MTDDEYRRWIQTQPSCVSGRYSEWVNGEGRNPACHVRRASRSGDAYKGELCCIPLTHEEHRDQHQHGEARCLERHLGGMWSPESAKAFFDEQATTYRQRWDFLRR